MTNTVEIPICQADSHDVIVVGGGLSGVCAALAAARAGASTLLTEAMPFVGGNGVTGLPISSFRARRSDELVVKGIPLEIVRRLEERGGTQGEIHEEAWLRIDPEKLQLLLAEMLEEAGVHLLCHSPLLAVRRSGNRLSECIFYNKDSAALSYTGQAFVDASGDAQLATLAGCRTAMGRQRDGKTQAMTLLFQLGGIDDEVAPDFEGVREIWSRLRQEGAQWRNPTAKPGFGPLAGKPGHRCFNVTRIFVEKGTDHRLLTAAELEGRRQITEFIEDFLRPHVPGFEKCFLTQIARIGIRETRRIIGLYEMSKEELLAAKKFPDGIACNAASVEIHDPEGGDVRWESPPLGSYYTIPYGCIASADADNLFASGRCLSASREALAAIRVLSAAMATGQAAGAAAALCASSGRSSSDLDVGALRDLLVSQGARVD